MILSFCSGFTRAYTFTFSTIFINSLCVNAVSSEPVKTRSSSVTIIPNFSAIALAVSLWSPVIITGIIPASLHSETACFASSRGGSIMPTNPISVNSFSIKLASEVSGKDESVFIAYPKTRYPFSAISLTLRSNSGISDF